MHSMRGYHTATLLQDGRLLVAGGYNNSQRLKDAEILYFDFVDNNWKWISIDPMNEARELATATLLQNGMVLVSGGRNAADETVDSTELCDPATGRWTLSGNLTVPHMYHTAALLSSGQVLVAGGSDNGSKLAEAELFRPDAGFQESWRPVLDSVTSSISSGQGITITGDQLRGYQSMEAAGGTGNSSATNYPLLQIRHLDNGLIRWLMPDPAIGFSPSGFKSAPMDDFPRGPALVTVFVNGIPSQSKMVQLVQVDQPPILQIFLPVIRK
jgi:hypothetical protein